MPPDPILRREPVILGSDSQFAFAQTDAADVTTVRLAQLTDVHPTPRARDLATVLTLDNRDSATTDTLHAMVASPDNALLLTYVFQESLPLANDPFVDHNVSLFLMRTGVQVEFVNEHRFGVLNKSVLPSARLLEHITQQVAAGSLDPEGAGFLDYRVQVEGPEIAPPAFRWNRDGSFTVTFTLEVYAVYGGGQLERFAGTEPFSRTYRLRNGALEFAGWNLLPGLAALRHETFVIAAGTPANPRVITFEKQTIEFLAGSPPVLTRGGRLAARTASAIPRRYR